MDIYLNGQRLDYDLETERTLGEVSAGVQAWLAGGDLCVSGLTVDGRPLPPGAAESDWGRISVETVLRLDIAVTPISVSRLSALRATAEYLEVFIKALEGRDERLLGDLSSGYPAMVESVRTLISPQPGEPLYERLLVLDRHLAGNTPEGITAWPAGTAQEALDAAGGISAVVAEKIREWDDPRGALAGVRGSLERAIRDATDVSVLLQTGREREAMARVVTFTQLAQSLLAIVQRILDGSGLPIPLVGEQTLEIYGADLNRVLKELLEAIDAHDTVLIGDLLEYEVAPRILRLTAAVRTLEPEGASGASDGAGKRR